MANLTRVQAAERLGLTVRHLNRLASQGGGPPYLRLGGAVRYREADLAEWEAENLVGHAAEWKAARRGAA